MRVKIQQFLFGGELFSWAIVGQNIGRSLIKLGHTVDFVSTDGIQDRYIPIDLKQYVKENPSGQYDTQISYTMPHNFPRYLANGNKNRFGIYNFDGTAYPPQFVKYTSQCDLILPSSNFSSEVMLNGKVPKNKIKVIPHGINPDEFKTNEVYPLKTNKKYKILLNIATPHLRKNLRDTLKAFGMAFTNQDDVCLVIKVNKGEYKEKGKSRFVVDFDKELKLYRETFKNSAQIIVISGFINNLASLYNACQIVYGLSHMEMWWLPGLEGFATNKIVVSPRYGGQMHYLNDDNSILVNGKIIRMPGTYQYMFPQIQATMFQADLQDAAKKLKYVISNYNELLEKFKPKMIEVVSQLTWDNVAKQIMELTK